jgi:hypothetical protein
MKKGIIINSIATTLLLSVFSTGIFAQGALTNSTAPSAIKTTAGEATDYVTIGSQLGYQVAKTDFGALAATFPTVFGWRVANSDGTPTAAANYTLYNSVGTGSLTADADATNNSGYFTENQISVYWPTVGTYKLYTTEKVRVTPFCAGTEENLDVNVLARPKVSGWNVTTSPSGCGLTGDILIPFKCDGSRTITVTYTVTYTPLTGTASTSNGTTTVALGATVYGASNQDGTITIPVTGGNFGTYSVQIDEVTDNVTTKSFASYTTASADRPTAPYVFYSLPTPTTSPIQHVTNL